MHFFKHSTQIQSFTHKHSDKNYAHINQTSLFSLHKFQAFKSIKLLNQVLISVIILGVSSFSTVGKLYDIPMIIKAADCRRKPGLLIQLGSNSIPNAPNIGTYVWNTALKLFSSPSLSWVTEMKYLNFY